MLRLHRQRKGGPGFPKASHVREMNCHAATHLIMASERSASASWLLRASIPCIIWWAPFPKVNDCQGCCIRRSSMHELMIHLLRCLAERGFRFCSSAPSERAGQQRLIHLETQVYELGSANLNLWFPFALFLACTSSTGYPHCSSLFFSTATVLFLFFSFFHESSRVKQKKIGTLCLLSSHC